MMKINVAYPQFGSQKLIELEDEKKMRLFTDRRLSEEVPGDVLGDEWKGYVFKITGGMDKQGFAMKQGVALNHRTRLLLDGTTGLYRPRRDGCRKRKSVRGCIIASDIAVVNLVIVKKGEQQIPGLTDSESNKPSTRGPKRANNIRKLWGLSKEDDVRPYVSRKKVVGKNGKEKSKAPKIQRLITPQSIHKKRRALAVRNQKFEKSRKEAAEYATLLNNIRKEKKQAYITSKRVASERRSERASQKADK